MVQKSSVHPCWFQNSRTIHRISNLCHRSPENNDDDCDFERVSPYLIIGIICVGIPIGSTYGAKIRNTSSTWWFQRLFRMCLPKKLGKGSYLSRASFWKHQVVIAIASVSVTKMNEGAFEYFIVVCIWSNLPQTNEFKTSSWLLLVVYMFFQLPSGHLFCCWGKTGSWREENLRILKGWKMWIPRRRMAWSVVRMDWRSIFFLMSTCQELRFFNSFDELQLGGVSLKDAEERYKWKQTALILCEVDWNHVCI